MKKVGLILVVVVLVVIAVAWWWVRGNIDGVVKHAIATQGSVMVRAPVTVGAVELRPGNGVVRDLTVANPPGFKTPHAVKVAAIELDMDVASVATDVVVIRKLVIKSPDVIYEQADGTTNLDVIQENIASYLGLGDKRKEPGGKKLIVEELVVQGAKARASTALLQGQAVAMAVPDFTLRNIGKDKGGIPPGEVGREVTQALKQRVASVISVEGLARSAGQTLDKAGQAVKGLFGK